MEKLEREAEQMRRVMHRIAEEVYGYYPSDAARQAVDDVTATCDWRQLATATLFWSRLGAAIDAELVRSVRHHNERDKMH